MYNAVRFSSTASNLVRGHYSIDTAVEHWTAFINVRTQQMDAAYACWNARQEGFTITPIHIKSG